MSYNAFLSQFFYLNVLKQRFSVFLSAWVYTLRKEEYQVDEEQRRGDHILA